MYEVMNMNYERKSIWEVQKQYNMRAKQCRALHFYCTVQVYNLLVGQVMECKRLYATQCHLRRWEPVTNINSE